MNVMETIRKLIDCKTNQLPHSPHKLSDRTGLLEYLLAGISASALKIPKIRLEHNRTQAGARPARELTERESIGTDWSAGDFDAVM